MHHYRQKTSEALNNGEKHFLKEYSFFDMCFFFFLIFVVLKFRFSKKATKFDVYLVNVNSSGRLFQIFVAFSECSNFTS